MLRRDTFALTALLALLTALGPLAMDLYLPSFPAIARTLDASAAHVQLTISSYLIGFASGQLVYGPISDRFGRKPVLSIALVVFALGTLACALAPTIDTLIAARVVQGAGASGVIVLARAVVRDLYEGPRAARELSTMAAIMGLTPILAPVGGGVLQEMFGWRAGFVAVLVAGLAAIVVVNRRLPETVPPLASEHHVLRDMITSFGIVGRNPVFLAHVAIVTTTFAGLFAYISGSSFVVQGILGLTPIQFGLLYGVSSLGFISGTFTAAQVVMRIGVDRTIGFGAAAMSAGGLALIAATALAPKSAIAFALAMAVFLAGFGLATPQALAGAMQPFPKRAGAASSLLGGVQQTVGAVLGAIVGHALGASAWPMVIAVAGTGFLTLAIWLATRRIRTTGAKHV